MISRQYAKKGGWVFHWKVTLTHSILLLTEREKFVNNVLPM